MELLRDLVVILMLSIAVIPLFHRLRLPALIGFLLIGVIAGPHGLGAVNAVDDVEKLAEIGVVLLLFTIGLEFSLGSLMRIKKIVFVGGSLQVATTVVAVLVIARATGFPLREAIFCGFLVSLSSTAIVLKILQEKGQVEAPHGRAILGILIFQDLAVVPMMLVTPLLAGGGEEIARPLLILLAKAVGTILVVFAAARWIVPAILSLVARTRSRELFLLGVFFVLLASEWMAVSVGLSLALGAFLAGLIISESPYSVQALGNILPFRDAFIGLFFVSIGMLLNVQFLYAHLTVLLIIAFCVIAGKSLLAGLVGLALGFPLRTAILTGLALAQVGEFSFILSRTGLDSRLLANDVYQGFLAVTILTMAAAPLVLACAPRAAAIICSLPLLRRIQPAIPAELQVEKRHLADHLIIVGYGVNGYHLARAARSGGIPYIVIEMNSDTVMREQAKGEPIFFGDATHDIVLDHADLRQARVMVVAISDRDATDRIIRAARRLHSDLHIITRTRFVQDVGVLEEAGANEVIPEEFETSIEIFTRVLTRYLIPSDEIEGLVSQVRADNYEMLRSPAPRQPARMREVVPHLADVEVHAHRVAAKSLADGRSIGEIDFRRTYAVTVLAVRREDETIPNPPAETRLLPGDIVIMLAHPDEIARAAGLFTPVAG